MTSLPQDAYRVFAEAEKGALAALPDLKDRQVVAAVSGGLDSMVLLYFLVWLNKRQPFDLTIAHVHHGLRPEADNDEALVTQVATELKIPLKVSRVDVKALAEKNGESIEMAGRRARYDFFERLATSDRPEARSDNLPTDEKHGALIALAHHQQDQAETVLLHLTRGSGLKGIAGMKIVDGNRWRPFLSCTRADLEKAQAALDIPYAVDLSNEDSDFLRNRLRHELLPLWSTLAGHDMSQKLADFASLAALDDLALERVAMQVAKALKTARGKLAIAPLLEYPVGVVRRVIDLVFEEISGVRLGRRHIELLYASLLDAKQARRIDLPAGVTAHVSYGQLSFVTG